MPSATRMCPDSGPPVTGSGVGTARLGTRMRQISARERSVPRPAALPERNARAPRPSTGRNADADATLGVLAVRRTPVFDPFEDHDDPSNDPGPNVRRTSTGPAPEQGPRRAELRPLRGARRVPPKRGPDPRIWFIRGSIGIAALAGLWLGLQTLFPVTESRVSQAPTPVEPVDASAVGAPEPPAVQPAAQQPIPTPVAQTAPAPEGDRLPGLPTPAPAVAAQAAPAAPASAAPPAPAQPQAAAPPAPQPAAAEPKPREETPSQQPVGQAPIEPIPPPPSEQPSSPPPPSAEQQAAEAQRAAAAPPAPKPQSPPPAPKPQAPPVAAPSGGAFALAASASPVNPISEQAVVTISVRATQGGAPLAGASCMATIYYRTNTVKQPNGGFRTNASGVGSFTLDARGTTYGHYIPIDVTCSGRGGTTTARTGFTPVKGR